MTDRLGATIVPATGSLRDALEAVDRGAAGIALAVDEHGRLAGVATDGDIRRALLRGATLEDPIAGVLSMTFVSVDARGGRADALDLMRARRIDAIPVIDADGRPVALHLLQAFITPEARPNWAVIMAGGEGRRLRPLTDSVPKPMLSVAGRPILERIVLHLVGAGVTRIFVSVNYLAHVIEDHFGDGAGYGARIEYLRETEPLGTGGAIGLLPEPPVDPILVLNGDLVTNVDVGALLALHAARGFAATIGTRRYMHTVPFGCVTRDGDRVTALEEKPSIVREVNTGIYAIDPAIVRLVEPGVALTMPEFIGRVIDQGSPVGAFEVEDDWIDVGQRDQLARAREGG
jgi:dTDP-glucose pyrophosphorylase